MKQVLRRAREPRGERKQRTREQLMDAALQLMVRGRSFTNLSLREITREAGVVPTAFYRHFQSLDELGLALVEESGMTLRRLLREARNSRLPDTDLVRVSVRIYRDYLEQNRLAFMFIASERFGGSAVLRRAIGNEVSHFVTELAQDLRQMGILPQLSTTALQMVCAMVVSIMLNAARDILDLPAGQPRVENELIETFVRQLRVIFLGARQFREAPLQVLPARVGPDALLPDFRAADPEVL